jgi:dipeptidyl aminopeptidase/acylaminoacyl peptidase
MNTSLHVSIARRILLAGLFAGLVAVLPAATVPASAADETAHARTYWLIVGSERDSQMRPYAIRSDGSRLTPLAPRSGASLDPSAVSRDGSTIAYTNSYDGPHQGIYISRANGAGLRRIVSEGWATVLSPDGKRLAFEYGSPSRVDVIGTDGRNRRRLGSGTNSGIEWSPDGKALLMTIEAPRFPRNAIVIRPLRGKQRVVRRAAWIGDAKWSPDGRWIAYSRFHGEDRSNGLYLIRPNGTRRHRVAKDSGSFAWSRDGRRLALTIGVSGDIGVVGVSGRGFRRLRLRGFGLIDRLTWSPDGRHLVFAAPRPVRKEGTKEASRIWIVGADGRGLRRVTKMVGGFDLVGWTRVAPAGPPAPPLLPSERVLGADTVATGTRIASLSADGSRVAFIVQSTAADCDHAVVWTPAARALDRFSRPSECDRGRYGTREYDVELAGSRVAWLSAGGCGNFCDILLSSATLGQRTPAVLATTSAEAGTDYDYHLHGHGELLVFNDGPRLVRIGGGTEKCQDVGRAPAVCAILRRSDHASPADSVSGQRIAIRENNAVAVVDEHGALVRVFPFAPGDVRAARLDGDHLVVARPSSLDVYDVVSGQGLLQRPLASGYGLVDVDGGVAVLGREDTLMLLRLDDGRSSTLTPGAGPVLADLEPPGLYYSYTTKDGGGRVVFVPRSELALR